MRKKNILFLTILLLISGCSSGWKGYDKENLEKYLSIPDFPELTLLKEISVTDDDIENEIEKLLLEKAEFEITDDPYEKGMMVSLVVCAFIDGLSIESLSGELTVRNTDRLDTVKKAIANSVIGKKAGQSVTVKIAIPSGYTEEIVSSSVAEYHISVTSVKKCSIPVLTDENCSQIVPGCSSVDKLRETIRKRLSDPGEHNSELRYEAWDNYFEAADMKKVPYEVYMTFYNALILPYESLADIKKITMEEYAVNYCGCSLEELKLSISEKALKKTKEALLVHQTAKKLGITYSPAELDSFVRAQTGDYGEFEGVDDFIEYFGEDNVIISLLREKILDYYSK